MAPRHREIPPNVPHIQATGMLAWKQIHTAASDNNDDDAHDDDDDDDDDDDNDGDDDDDDDDDDDVAGNKQVNMIPVGCYTKAH